MFLLEYISFLNVLMLNLLYHPCLKLDLSGIWSDVFISSLMHVLIVLVSYALSAIINRGLYFFKPLIDAIANFTSCLGPFTAYEYSIILESTSIAIWYLVKFFTS